MYSINIRISDVFIIIYCLLFLLLLLFFISFIHSSILYYMFPAVFHDVLESFLHIHFKAVYIAFSDIFSVHANSFAYAVKVSYFAFYRVVFFYRFVKK